MGLWHRPDWPASYHQVNGRRKVLIILIQSSQRGMNHRSIEHGKCPTLLSMGLWPEKYWLKHVLDAGGEKKKTHVFWKPLCSMNFTNSAANICPYILLLAKSKTYMIGFPESRDTPTSLNHPPYKCIYKYIQYICIYVCELLFAISCWGSEESGPFSCPGGMCSSNACLQPLWAAASIATFRETRSNFSPERHKTCEAEIIHGVLASLVIW